MIQRPLICQTDALPPRRSRKPGDMITTSVARRAAPVRKDEAMRPGRAGSRCRRDAMTCCSVIGLAVIATILAAATVVSAQPTEVAKAAAAPIMKQLEAFRR